MRHWFISDQSNSSSDYFTVLLIFKFNIMILSVHQNLLIFDINFSCCKRVTHLHHKWFVYSLLPVALGVKKSVLHIRKHTARYRGANTWRVVTVTQTQYTGLGALPVSVGSRRWQGVWTWHVAASDVHVPGGGSVRRLNVSETVLMFWDATWANNAKCTLIAV
jgi:hypothetical protein